MNVVNINSNTARDWEPSPKIQRQHWQRQRNYSTNVSRENFRGRKNEGGDSWRRFSSVQRPSRLQLDGQGGDRDRQDWRRSDRDSSELVRNQSGEFGRRGSRVRDVTPGPEFDQGREQNSGWEGRGKARRDREIGQDFVRDSSQLGRSRSRVQDATPGPQFDQTEQNVTREGRGQGRRDREIGQDSRDSRESGRSRSRVQDATPGPQFDQTEQNVTREGRGQGRRDREIGQDLRDSRSLEGPVLACKTPPRARSLIKRSGTQPGNGGEGRPLKPSLNPFRTSGPGGRAMFRNEDSVQIVIP